MSDNNTPTPAAANASAAPEAPAGNGKRRRALTALAAVVIVAGGGWGLYEWLVASHYEDTDNAYVQGNVIQITPQIGGTVMAINADDTDFVKAGQPLVQLDPADAKVALEQAEAALAQAVRQVRTLYANNGSLAAQVTLRQSDIVKAQSDIAKAQDDLQRRRALSGNGAVSKEELNHAETALDNARSQLAAAQAGVVAAREALASNQSLTEGTSVAQHPSVLAAAAKVREAYLATQRVALPAPVDGYVAKRTVQLGQRVAAGTPMMSIVPLNQLWVDANFKEVQLRNIRIDQPVKLRADVYGKKVEYTGKVAGLGVGTGSAFALLPAQNATGNWIKVVQRVPVRIALDPEQLKANPLRIGLSMDAEIDISQKSGKMLADAPRPTAISQTQVYSKLDQGADAEVDRIVAANLGRGAPAASAAPAAAGRSAVPAAAAGAAAQAASQSHPG
ncbi:HlyD family efflux transporter periplasmic adaptor subunit [Variovorax sp. V59]|uniref:Membrane fusion protein (Multidrug efflux system) n=2 Tax=Variovorax TaxID=34072 RepID=A0AAE4C1C5_VARPD|nr:MULTISPECIES: efflux RND transporter periplasmic adaptor subunit [Variovorax]MBD9668351.1 efflux RND transporter periplasmic adaptor subunit [Variovorax sp. VRV01]MDP9968348.1 membrane fusion protein (multidrug efflux system) [Variovorax paradoxus]MDR6430054.1 membrane fusion protein (multidrug efflux system) [Variovorax paradoxus]MDR6456756.1 membrane fusion protein (multidrug efflux system) [Variovorax paradoxus]TWD74661.1 membrane fusion protein (multidrug efflux system) [Variovorax beij